MKAEDPVDALLAQAARCYTKAPAEAVQLADEALALLGPDAAAERRARALMTRGVSLAYAGQYADSLQILQQALDLVPANTPLLRAQVLRSLCVANHELGALDQSLQWATQAVETARAAHAEPAQLADTLLSLGVAFSTHGDTEAGLRQYQEVLAIYESLGDQNGAMQALNNIGIACKNLQRYEESLQYLQRAMALADSLQLPGAAAVVAANLGEPLWRLGRIDEARTAMLDAVRRNAANGYFGGETHARILLGELLHAQGDSQSALQQLRAALELARRVGARTHLARVHKALAEVHKAAGSFELGLQHFEAFHAAERERFNEDSHRKMRALQVQFDLARAQQEVQRARLEAAALVTQSRTDALTGLANRRALDECLAAEFARARRQGHSLALAMADVDNFKLINDSHGHTTGDQVLRTVATLLRQHCRAIDIVARYGGEEFCIVFLETEATFAARACEQMRAAVAQHDWNALRPGLVVTLSMGLAERGSLDDEAALLAAADGQLYAAKRGGKNRVCPPPGPAGLGF